MFNIDYIPSGVLNFDYITSSGVPNTDYVPYVLRFFLLSTEFHLDLLGNHLQSDVSEFQEMLFYINTCSNCIKGLKEELLLLQYLGVYTKKIKKIPQKFQKKETFF